MVAPSQQVRTSDHGLIVWTQFLDSAGFDRLNEKSLGNYANLSLQLGWHSSEHWSHPTEWSGRGFTVRALEGPYFLPGGAYAGVVDLDLADLNEVDHAFRAAWERTNARVLPGWVVTRSGGAVRTLTMPPRGSKASRELASGVARETPLYDWLYSLAGGDLQGGWRVQIAISSNVFAKRIARELGTSDVLREFRLARSRGERGQDDPLILPCGAFGLGFFKAEDDSPEVDRVHLLLRKGGHGSAVTRNVEVSSIAGNPYFRSTMLEQQDLYAALRETLTPRQAAESLPHLVAPAGGLRGVAGPNAVVATPSGVRRMRTNVG